MAISLTVGGSTAQILVQGALLSSFALTSVDPSVATVNSSGVVTAVAAGLVAIKVRRTSDGETKNILFRVKDLDEVIIPVINDHVYGSEAFTGEAPAVESVDPAGYGAGPYGAGGYGS